MTDDEKVQKLFSAVEGLKAAREARDLPGGLVRFKTVDIGEIARALGWGEKRVIKLPVIFRPGHFRSGARIFCNYESRRKVHEAPSVKFSEVQLHNKTYCKEFSGSCSVLLDVHCGLCPGCETLYCCWSDRLSAVAAGDFEDVPRHGVEVKRPPTLDEQLRHARKMVCIIEAALRNGAPRAYVATIDGEPYVLDDLMRQFQEWKRIVLDLIAKQHDEGVRR